MSDRLPVAVLVSGEGSNLLAIAAEAAQGQLPIEIRAVLADRDAPALARARAAGLEAIAVPRANYPDRPSHEAALAARIDAAGAGLIVLAGYMRILSPEFVAHYAGRMLNIHPSLLPLLKGLSTHARAIADGLREHGASVHFVTADLDGGPVIAQARVPVLASDSPASLAARVHAAEHRLYPEVIGWFARGRLALRNGQVWLDGRALKEPVRIDGAANSAGATRQTAGSA